jgi:hypothetical protein
MVAITGNTYPVRIQLKALGGRWDAASKVWIVPEAVAEQARALVPGARGERRQRICASCGCRINYGVYCGKCEFGR